MDRALAPALHDAIAALYRQARIRMQAVSSADNVLGHLQLVQEGLGFALLPDSVGALLPPGVVLKPLAYDPVPTVSIVIAWKAGNRLTARAHLRRSRPAVGVERERRHTSHGPAQKVLAAPTPDR